MGSAKFAERLKELLDWENVSGYDVAKATGIPLKSMHNWLRGIYYPSYKALCSLTVYFKVSSDYLLGLTDVYEERNYCKNDVENGQRSLAGFLQEYLNKNGCTRYRLAKDLGVGQTTLARWLYKGSMPEVSVLIRIADLLAMSVDDLLNRG